ncbi:MAG: hypothetical protein AAF732_10045 [Pseudomonadota bacterium]
MAYVGHHEIQQTVVSNEVSNLEQVWIEAEARADRAKYRANQAQQAIAELSSLAGRNNGEVTLLVSEAERLVARRDKAEQEAVAAFDRFWKAKSDT